MNTDKLVREQLLHLAFGGNAHLPYKKIIKEYPLEIINKQAKGIEYTPWQLLEHIRIAQKDILEFVVDPQYKSPNWPDDYWSKEKTASDEMWNETCKMFLRDLKRVEDLIKDPQTDFYSPIPHAKDYTIYREILLIADHNSYHFGQLVLLKKLLNN